MPVDPCVIQVVCLCSSQEKTVAGDHATTGTTLVGVVLSSSVGRRGATKTKKAAGTSRIAAETAAALRERGLSARTRLAKKGVLATASATEAVLAAAETKVPEAADPRRPNGDGMAPALTEPTAVPTAANTKTDSSSPQPEIFTEGEGGGFADHHQSMAGDAENADDNMGLGGGEQQQMKAPKRAKKDEYPLKELRSSRRRSNLHAPPQQSNATTNGKTNSKQRWSTGGNGGTVAVESSRSSRRGGDVAASTTTPIKTTPAKGEKEVVSEPPNGRAESVNKKEEEEEEKEQGQQADVAVEPSSLVANNNNYLDKSRVPIILNSSAVSEEDERPESVANTNTNGPESNSEDPPVIQMNTVQESGVKVEEEEVEKLQDEGKQTEHTLEEEMKGETTQEQPAEQQEEEEVVVVAKKDEELQWSPPQEQVHNNEQTSSAQLQMLMGPPAEMSSCSVVDQLKAMASDAALLEELVLTTPTKKLTEQLCMVLKDQELALQQQEQQQQQQEQAQHQQQQQEQQPVSNPSSQTLLKESAEMEQMLGDLAGTSELDLFQVFKSFESGPAVDDGVATGTEGNLLSLLVADDDVDMMMASAEQSPEKCLASARLVVDKESQDQELDIAERKKMLAEMEQEMSQMQRRRDFLLRRLRKQQVHHLGRQLSEEVVGLFELSARAPSVVLPKVLTAAAVPVGNYNKIKYLKNSARGVDADPLVSNDGIALDDPSIEDVEDLTPASIVMRNDSPSSMLVDLKGRHQTAVGHHPFIKPPSPKSIRSFVQKVVATQQHQAEQQTASGSVGPVTGSVSKANKSSSFIPNNKKLLPSVLDDGHRLQLTNNVGLLKTELRIVERAIDSEATASSSGGESADELINYSNSVQESLAIANRAAWQWAQERARLASRWNWLTAEISDLEYRIRQHTDLHNQLRKSKGPVLLLRPGTDKDGATMSDAAGTTTGTAAPSTKTPVTVNGYRGLLPGQYSSAKAFDGSVGADGFMADVENEVEGTASRTRPYQRQAFKKRKLVQTMNLHTISKKAARPSSIKCGCQWPQQPCALCTGRIDPTIPRPLPDMINRLQRAALLDPCLHPCLSFPEDVSQSIRCEAVMADPKWQQKVLKSSKTALKSSIVAAAASAGGTYKALKLAKKEEVMEAKKATKKYTQGLISRYKKSKSKNRGTHTKYVQLLKQQKSRKAVIKACLGVPLSHGSVHSGGASGGGGVGAAGSSFDIGEYESGTLARSRNASPTHHYYRQDRIERRSRHSYDIDNIVIPYSVAASTRVEILPYKEIPTPKWKLVDETDLDDDIQVETNQYQHQQQQAASSDSNSSTITALEFDSEEFLDEYIQEKHNRALLEERKKFSTFLKFPYSTRSRANRRIDSRAESSGANTPDPASPAPNTPSIGGGDQESIPSPMCPSTPAHELVLESETSSQGPLTSTGNRIASNERRRTISLKMLSHQNSTASDAGMSRPRSQTPEPSGPLFERLEYPLSDRKYEDMLKQMPLNHERLDDICQLSADDGMSGVVVVAAAAAGAAAASGESVSSACSGAAKKTRGVTWDPIVDLTESAAELTEDGGEEQQHLIKLRSLEDSDTDSVDSVPPEDPNDPEWVKS